MDIAYTFLGGYCESYVNKLILLKSEDINKVEANIREFVLISILFYNNLENESTLK